MNTKIRIVAIVISSVLGFFGPQRAWAEPLPSTKGASDAVVPKSADSPKLYSKFEWTGLTTCASHSATAATVASWKREGLSQAEITDHYNKTLSQTILAMTLSIVDKVFSESSVPVGAYAISFFSRCATNIAEVPEENIFASRVCFTHMYTASNAAKIKFSGANRASAYERLSFPEGAATLVPVIDRAFSNPKKSSFEIGFDEWFLCMSEFS